MNNIRTMYRAELMSMASQRVVYAKSRIGTSLLLVASIALCFIAADASAQPNMPSKVEISWDRYYDYPQTKEWIEKIASAYPDLVKVESVGKSIQGREMLVAIVTSAKGGPHTGKPAMWIDGNIHGNEVQASEVVLYTLWYLTKAYGQNDKLTDLLDSYAFYLAPMMNPDGRQYWFDHANTPHSSRHNQRPIDGDRDGKVDEDGPDDLDKDGHITLMWRADPMGRWVRSQTDDRVFVRLRDDQSAAAGVITYESLGEEGIDNDADGRINEDGPFGDDMNRNWPSDWQPEHIQGGAGPFPLSSPETEAIAKFILAHPNIAAVQSYHNFGGMIIRGPGAAYREGLYPAEDARVYDELARTGEQMLPYYRYLVLFSGLYGVHGGFVNWASESLGAFAFTNELWATGKYFQRENLNPGEDQQWLWRDRLAFGAEYSALKEFDHPRFGKILIGGPNKWSSRVTPTFMLEEECHRNFAFTAYHAEQMPLVKFGRLEVKPVKDEAGNAVSGVWRVRFEIINTKLIPTRSALARRERIGWPDLLECGAAGKTLPKVLAINKLANWHDATPEPRTGEGMREPSRLLVPEGVPGRRALIFELIVEGPADAKCTVRYSSQWASTIESVLQLRAPNP